MIDGALTINGIDRTRARLMAAGHGMGRRARIPGKPADEPPPRFVPRYYEIEQALRTRIADLKPDDPLPSDAMLCEEFGVSRMTARNAVQRLDPGGDRLPRAGPRHVRRRAAGAPPGGQPAVVHRGDAPPRPRPELAGPRRARCASRAPPRRRGCSSQPDTLVIALRRLRFADDEPMAIEEAVFPAAGSPALLRAADLEHRSLHDTLVEGGHIPTMGRARLGAEAAGPEDAALLGVPVGSPLLVEKRVIHDQDGRPLELCESRYAGDRYGLDVQFDVELPSP